MSRYTGPMRQTGARQAQYLMVQRARRMSDAMLKRLAEEPYNGFGTLRMVREVLPGHFVDITVLASPGMPPQVNAKFAAPRPEEGGEEVVEEVLPQFTHYLAQIEDGDGNRQDVHYSAVGELIPGEQGLRYLDTGEIPAGAFKWVDPVNRLVFTYNSRSTAREGGNGRNTIFHGGIAFEPDLDNPGVDLVAISTRGMSVGSFDENAEFILVFEDGTVYTMPAVYNPSGGPIPVTFHGTISMPTFTVPDIGLDFSGDPEDWPLVAQPDDLMLPDKAEFVLAPDGRSLAVVSNLTAEGRDYFAAWPRLTWECALFNSDGDFDPQPWALTHTDPWPQYGESWSRNYNWTYTGLIDPEITGVATVHSGSFSSSESKNLDEEFEVTLFVDYDETGTLRRHWFKFTSSGNGNRSGGSTEWFGDLDLTFNQSNSSTVSTESQFRFGVNSSELFSIDGSFTESSSNGKSSASGSMPYPVVLLGRQHMDVPCITYNSREGEKYQHFFARGDLRYEVYWWDGIKATQGELDVERNEEAYPEELAPDGFGYTLADILRFRGDTMWAILASPPPPFTTPNRTTDDSDSETFNDAFGDRPENLAKFLNMVSPQSQDILYTLWRADNMLDPGLEDGRYLSGIIKQRFVMEQGRDAVWIETPIHTGSTAVPPFFYPVGTFKEKVSVVGRNFYLLPAP